MPSNDGFGRPIDDSSQVSDASPTVHAPWPYMDPVSQGRIERRYFEKGATIHFDKIPELQSWAPWVGFRSLVRVLFVTKRVIHFSLGAKRPLTATEIDATSEHAAASIRYLAWAQPASLAVAALCAWRRRATFRFAFYQPKMIKFDPFVFPSKRWPFLQDEAAARIWHVVRFGSYCPLSWFGAFFFFNSVQETSFHARMMRDPRLSNLYRDINRNNKAIGEFERRAQRRRLGLPDEQPGAHVPQSPQQHRGIAQSPVSQHTSEESIQMTQDNVPSAWQPENSLERPDAGMERAPSQASPSELQETSDSDAWSRNTEDDSGLFDDDDASPVSPSVKVQAKQTQNGSGGSAWERLRQQSRSTATQWEQGDSSGQERGWARLRQDKTPDTRDDSPATEDFAYSKQDEEREKRNYEKTQAQKEFDALLESERRGGGEGGWRRNN
ncbi:hypothetical protein F4779DRAFT_386415 [Xylariaceae sp. FL0662B]|nr:hypothetical protein F4779DRAFT_386415 [Xylariaceae sp. FL0662B]